MGALSDMMQSKGGSILISVLLGLGLAAAMFKVCQGRDCVVATGPNPKHVMDNSWRDGEDCYKYHKKSVECPGSAESDVDSGRTSVQTE